MSRKRTHEANDEDGTAEKKRKIHHDPFGASVATRTKCEAVRQWAKDFEWTTLDNVPVFGGKERNLFAFGHQVERMLELVKFPKGVLVLTAEPWISTCNVPKISVDLELERTLEEELKRIAKRLEPDEWLSSPELVAKATNHCFASPVPEVFDLLWRHTFPQQVQSDMITYQLCRPPPSHTQKNWSKFTFLQSGSANRDDYARTDPQHWGFLTIGCEHCVGNLVMHWCGLSRAVMRLVMAYYVFD